MRRVAGIAFCLLLSEATACYHVGRLDEADAGAGGDSDADSDGDSDADSDGDSDLVCGSEEWPDMDEIFDCPYQSAWPCYCYGEESEYCGNGAPCLGAEFESGMCASLCQLEDPPTCPETGPFGIGVVEVCDTYLYDGCLCLLSGCEDYMTDCPQMFLCVEPSCIPEEPGCEAGEGETKVCFPSNW